MESADTVFVVRADGMCMATWGLNEKQYRKKQRETGKEPLMLGLTVGLKDVVGEHGPTHTIGREDRERGCWVGCVNCGVAGSVKLTTTPCTKKASQPS